MKQIANVFLVTIAGIIYMASLFAMNTNAEPYNRDIDIWFNYPTVNPDTGSVITYDYVTERKLIELIDHAVPDSEIHIAIYLFTRRTVSDAIKRAVSDRNVKVHIIVEDGWKTITRKQKEIVSELERVSNHNANSSIEIVRCNKGCNGNVINHNKFFLFSHSGNKKNIVVQSSANINDATGRLYENSIVIAGDDGIYRAYLEYWHDLAKRSKNPDYYRSYNNLTHEPKSQYRIYFFPQRFGDTVLNILSRVDCDDNTTYIKVMTSHWESERGIDTKLADLAKSGCHVGVIIPDNTEKIKCDVLYNLYPAVDVYTLHDLPHSKYIIIEGIYENERGSTVVTGSHNFTLASLRRIDETLIEINNSKVVNEYKQNWEIIRSKSRKVAPGNTSTSITCNNFH